MLLLGGFSIAAALSKHYIAKAMATWILLKVGQKPSHVLLASMFVAMFASMWISNVAAPALCFSLLQPILRTLETGDQVSKSLVLGKPYTPCPDLPWAAIEVSWTQQSSRPCCCIFLKISGSLDRALLAHMSKILCKDNFFLCTSKPEQWRVAKELGLVALAR